MEHPAEFICGNADCQKVAQIACSACKSTVYCSDECRRQHWDEEHRQICASISVFTRPPFPLYTALTKRKIAKDAQFNHAQLNAAYGAVLGHAIGDSLGSLVEFKSSSVITGLLKDLVTPEGFAVMRKSYPMESVTITLLEHTMRMPGKTQYWPGSFGLYPGQVTDDTMMSIAVADALLTSSRSEEVLHHNARLFVRYFHPELAGEQAPTPFDKGNATRFAIDGRVLGASRVGAPVPYDSPVLESVMVSNAKLWDLAQKDRGLAGGNLSNGALMRTVPYAVRYWRGEAERQLVKTASDGAQLTHAAEEVVEGSVAYAIMVASLIRNAGSGYYTTRAELAIKDVRAYFAGAAQTDARTRVLAYINAAIADATPRRFDPNSVVPFDLPESPRDYGTYFNGLRAAVFFLVQASVHGVEYKEAMRHCIRAGGDTDTNAAITGGMVGAFWGLDHLPPLYVERVLAYKNSMVVWTTVEGKRVPTRGNPVAEWLLASRWTDLVPRLMSA
jgi:ADP-ribosyl-[dinitrogen reductase] hydrolase